ncbi:MAG TPA: amino acid ABC transporter permease [Anaerolineales bacterium]|nr:amino acid ABC transporter permease [Anaerolineales bacterium]
MAESTLPRDTADQVARGNLLYAEQQRKARRFRRNVGASWGILLLILIFLFSGQNILGIGTIQLDIEWMRENISFIALGIPETLKVSAWSIVLAMVLALLAALGRLSTIPPVYALSTFYVSLIRGTPLYLQIFFFFLALPQIGIILPGFWAGVLALGLNYGAYMSEIFRAGLASVSRGQREAAVAIGMTPRQTLQRIVLPQALRFAIPPIGNDFIAMTKDSALVAGTGFVHEIMWRATRVGRATFHSLEALIIAAIFYWMITLILTYIQSIIEARLAKGDR